MTYTYLLSGEDLGLAESELKGLLKFKGMKKKTKHSDRLAEAEEEQPLQLKRLALTHEVGKKILEIDLEDIEAFEPNFQPKGSFSVRAGLLDDIDKDKQDIEAVLGEKFSNEHNSVELESPETELKAYVGEENIVVSKVIETINRGIFEKRKNQNRPFSSPVSLDPKLARTLVNLSGVEPGEHILDPFCGTGGILIEAGLCGVGIAGTDIDQEMVEGCRKNLEEYGIINHDIRQESAEKAPEAFDRELDAIVTDLPYGRSSKKTEDIVDRFMNSIDSYDCRKVIMWNKDTLDGRNPDFNINVHSSLTRYIYIID